VHYSVSDILGQKIMDVELGILSAGDKSYSIDLTDQNPGIYFITLEIDGKTTSKKILFSK
jgi:hypothetical protein